jgi:hypothetical protein
MGKNKQTRKAENRKAQEEATLHSLIEYSKRLEVLQQQSSKLAARIGSAQRSQRTASLSLKYIEEVSRESEGLYSQLGRCFLLEPRDTVIETLSMEKNAAEQELPRLEAAFKQFEKLKKEQVDQITELKQQ